MKKRLLVLNNFSYLSELAEHYEEIHFAPIYKSKIQEKFFKDLFLEYQIKIPNLRWTEDFVLDVNDHVLSWDSDYELQFFGKHILPFQNRLFKKINFNIPEGFTPFRKKIEKLLPEKYNDAIKPLSTQVLDEIDYYFYQKKLASTYFEDRNGLVGRDFSTKFSSFLSCGALDVRYLYNEVKKFEIENGANKSTYWIIFELLWREFFYWHYQKHQKKYFSENGLIGDYDFSEFKKYDFDELRKLDGPPFFKACLNELEQSGFMSNRARQIFASIWLNDLDLNWRSGAYLFEEFLIDYDVYSNYGNWMYLAGVGVDPRGKRYFNVEKQLSQYDPDGTYLKRWT